MSDLLGVCIRCRWPVLASMETHWHCPHEGEVRHCMCQPTPCPPVAV